MAHLGYVLWEGRETGGTLKKNQSGRKGLRTCAGGFPGTLHDRGVLKGAALNIETDFFNTATSRVPGTTASGEPYVVQNAGFGVVMLDPASATTPSENVPLQRLFADLDDMQFIGGAHHLSHCGFRGSSH